ncbi:hypothetical protein Tco_1499029 [Tanacetum coccineum]
MEKINNSDDVRDVFMRIFLLFSFRQRPIAKGGGLCVADSHTGNHPEDDFMPLKTIRRLYSVFVRRSYLVFEGETFKSKGRYRVILPTSTQTILDAPPRYIGLYTHCFSLANLRLPLNDFFCEVLQYFKVHISRLNPFGCSKLTTFIVMCKAYDCEPSVELFRGFFNLCKDGSWLTFQKRSEKHIPSLLAKVITRIEGWHQRFFFIQDTIVPSKFPQLFLKDNMLYIKSFKDKLPSGIEQNPRFQCLGRYPVSACAFDDPILFLAGLQSSWEHGQQRPAIFVGGKEMFFRNFIYTEEDKDLTFLPKDLSPGLNTGSPSVSINTEPIRTNKEPTVEPATEPVNEGVGTTADSGGVPKEILLLFMLRVLQPALGKGSAKQGEDSALKDDTFVLSISDDDEGLEDCLEQAIMDNAVNRRSRELLEVIKKLRGEADVMRARELAREEECEGLRAKCEAVMNDFDKNPDVLLL